MRKDIKYTFGILKGRFRILKYGMRFRKVEHCDMLFKTLCAFHNMLIKEDGLDCNWMNYREALDQDQMNRNQFPPTLLRLHSLYVDQQNSSIEDQNVYPEWKRRLERSKDQFTFNNKRIVRKMPQHLYIECLVEHFNICYKKQQIVWPRRNLTHNNNCK